LVEKAPHLIIGQNSTGDTVLHLWVQSGTLHPVEFVANNHDIASDLRRNFIDQLCRTNKYGSNPLHDYALSVKMAKVLVNAYKRERAQLFSSPEFQPPWLMKDEYGETPLHRAIKFKKEQLASYLLSLDPIKFLENNDNLLFYSIEHKCPKVAEDTLGIVLRNASLTKLLIHDADGQNALHFAPECTGDIHTSFTAFLLFSLKKSCNSLLCLSPNKTDCQYNSSFFVKDVSKIDR